MKVSVVVATYNRLGLLAELLSDLAQQTLPEGSFDVTVIDDGSREPVEAALQPREWPYQLRIVRQENTGQARARHAGIMLSDGELVVILDDDMRVAPDFLEQHRALHEQGFEVVLGAIKSPSGQAAKPLFERFHGRQLDRFIADMRSGKPIPGAALCTGNVSFRRARYLDIGGFDLSLKRSEDRDLGIRLKKEGARFAFSEAASSTHGSDHTDWKVWLQRAFLYGVYDKRISAKHPDDGYNDPWHYLLLVHPLSRPLLLATVLSPRFGRLAAKGAIEAAKGADALGLEPVALDFTTLTYALEYFRGVRSEYPGLVATLRGVARFLRKKNALDPVNDVS
jgi:GT2 family glycosyltransferase